MTIYCIGCSHTEGSGLADYKFFQNDYPGEMISNQDEAIKWTYIRNKLLTQTPFLFEKLRQENLKKAWPAKLEKITNCEVINGAYGGAGITSLLMTTLYDLDMLSREGKQTKLVIVALPSMHRVPLVNRYPIKGYNPLAFKNIFPSMVDTAPEEYKEYCKSFYSSHSEEEILTFYLSQCLALKNVVKNITGKNPIFVNIFSIRKWKSIVDESNIFLLKHYWKMLEFDSILEQRTMESFLKDDQLMLPCGHFKEDVHEAFADYINSTFL